MSYKVFDQSNEVITDLTEDPSSTTVTSTAYDVAYYRASISSLTGMYNNIKNTFYNSSGTAALQSFYDSSTTNSVSVISIGPTLRNDSISSSSTSGVGTISFTLKDGSSSAQIIDFQDSTTLQSNTNAEYYGKLIDASSSAGTPKIYGEIFYNYGLMVLHGFGSDLSLSASLKNVSSTVTYDASPTGSNIGVSSLSFISTIEQSRQIFFLTALPKEFNYSNNPTFSSSGGLILSSQTADPTVYITGFGLYNDDNQLMAVGKLSIPLQKDFTEMLSIKAVIKF
jgi:hypothetical protein